MGAGNTKQTDFYDDENNQETTDVVDSNDDSVPAGEDEATLDQQGESTQLTSGMTKSKILAICLGVLIPIVVIVAIVVGVVLGTTSSSTSGSGTSGSGGGASSGNGSSTPIDSINYEYITGTSIIGTLIGSAPYSILGPFATSLAPFPYTFADPLNTTAWFTSNNRADTDFGSFGVPPIGTLFLLDLNRLEWTQPGLTNGVSIAQNFMGLAISPTPTVSSTEIASAGSRIVNTSGTSGSIIVDFPNQLSGSASNYVIYCQNGNYTFPQANTIVVSASIISTTSFTFFWSGGPSGTQDFRLNWFAVPKRQATSFTSFICPLAYVVQLTKNTGETELSGYTTLPITLSISGQTPLIFGQIQDATLNNGYVSTISVNNANTVYYEIGNAVSEGSPQTVNLVITVWRGIANGGTFTYS